MFLTFLSHPCSNCICLLWTHTCCNYDHNGWWFLTYDLELVMADFHRPSFTWYIVSWTAKLRAVKLYHGCFFVGFRFLLWNCYDKKNSYDIKSNFFKKYSHRAYCDINDSKFLKKYIHQFVYFDTSNQLIARNELQLTY